MIRGSISLLIAVLFSGAAAQAMPIPATALPTLASGWKPISLRVDVKNLMDDDSNHRIADELLVDRMKLVNNTWSQCAIRFLVRSTGNVSSKDLKVKFNPTSQGDLSELAHALNPKGFKGAIPVTVAGPWSFFDPNTGVFPFGLGWVFPGNTEKDPVSRIGAMISIKKIHGDDAGLIIAHELGHALSLGHSADGENLMLGGPKLVREQCDQARGFAERFLAEFIQ